MMQIDKPDMSSHSKKLANKSFLLKGEDITNFKNQSAVVKIMFQLTSQVDYLNLAGQIFGTENLTEQATKLASY
jgi:hypothetical protein